MLYGFIIVSVITFLYVLSLRQPLFIKNTQHKIKQYWFLMNTINYAIVVSLSTLYLFLAELNDYTFIITLAFSVLTFVFIQCLFTDFILRKADRFLLRYSILFTAIAGFWYIAQYFNPTYIWFYVFCLMLASTTVFMGKLNIGDSDGRALMLLVSSSFPFMVLEWSTPILLLLLAVYTIYNSYATIIDKKGFFAKRSIPLVPILLLPNILIIIYLMIYNMIKEPVLLF